MLKLLDQLDQDLDLLSFTAWHPFANTSCNIFLLWGGGGEHISVTKKIIIYIFDWKLHKLFFLHDSKLFIFFLTTKNRKKTFFWKLSIIGSQFSSLVAQRLLVQRDHGSNPSGTRKLFLLHFWVVISWLMLTFKLINDYAKW